jgi:hypothetical protein
MSIMVRSTSNESLDNMISYCTKWVHDFRLNEGNETYSRPIRAYDLRLLKWHKNITWMVKKAICWTKMFNFKRNETLKSLTLNYKMGNIFFAYKGLVVLLHFDRKNWRSNGISNLCASCPSCKVVNCPFMTSSDTIL